jgi:hypothetical protein
MDKLNRIIVIVVFSLILMAILPWAVSAGSESPSSIEQIFQKAKQDYLQKNMNSAAEQIQKGAAFVKGEAAKASGKGKAALTKSGEELEQLADDVKKGTVNSAGRIEKTFARAYIALAADAHIKSTESWTKKEAAKAGASLDSAAEYLERSIDWTGQKVEKSTKIAIQKSKDLSLRLKERGDVIGEEVRKGLKDAGSEIEKFGKRISSK